MCLVYSASEQDTLAGELVEDIDQVDVLELVGKRIESVPNSLVAGGGNADFHGIRKRGSLQRLDLGETWWRRRGRCVSLPESPSDVSKE